MLIPCIISLVSNGIILPRNVLRYLDVIKTDNRDNELNKELDYDYIEYVYGVDLRPEPQKKDNENAEHSPSYPRKKAAAEPEDAARMELYDWIQCIVTALLCGILLFVFVGRVIGVVGSSMFPTLHSGDRVITSNLFFTPEYGDIIVFRSPTYGESTLVKRVIATEGQTIDIDFDRGIVYIDGRAIQEDYIAELTTISDDFDGPLTVPEGFLFVMGDNRNKSTDSRSDLIGLVDTRTIIGKVYWLIIPGPDADGSRDWSRVGSVYKNFK